MQQVQVLNSSNTDVILFGGAGYVGSSFKKVMTERDISFFAPPSDMLNLLNFESIKYVVGEIRPSIVINCAGYTGKPNVDTCEVNKEVTKLGNVNVPFNLVQICDEVDVPLGHVSSGCIYNGYDKVFTEEDEPNFTEKTGGSYYSETKAGAEKLLASMDSKCYMWRLRIPFDEVDSPRNYLTKLQTYDTLLNLDNSISHLREFTEACLRTWKINAPYGIYNVVNSNPVKAEGVIELIRKHLPFDKEVKFMSDVEKFYEAVGAKAPRSNCVLSNEKLSSVGVEMKDSHEAIEESLKNWKNE